MADGSARGLIRLPGSGHVDILLNAHAREAALGWIADALGLRFSGRLAPLRWHWLAIGSGTLLLVLATWRGRPARLAHRAGLAVQLAILAVLWCGALWLASVVTPYIALVPTQEGRAVVCAIVVTAAALALLIPLRRTALLPRTPTAVRWPHAATGIALGIAVQLCLELLLRSAYSTDAGAHRLLLFLLFWCLTLPALLLTSFVSEAATAPPAEILFGTLTAALAPLLFIRMALLPVETLGWALVVLGAMRIGGWPAPVAAVAGSLILARCASLVCALY